LVYITPKQADNKEKKQELSAEEAFAHYKSAGKAFLVNITPIRSVTASESMDDTIALTRLLYSNTYPRQQKGAEGNTVATKMPRYLAIPGH